MEKPAYRRILLKISGEAIAGSRGFGIDNHTLNTLAARILEVHGMGIQVAVVVGAGNFWRGRDGKGMDRSAADHMGMLGTVINSLALQDTMERHGVTTRVMTAIHMNQIAEPYIRRKAVSHLEHGEIVIFACGTGNPFFSTDTAAALRAAEINADVILFAKNVDGIYTDDPRKHPEATRYRRLTYHEVISKKLEAIDMTAASLCMDNNMPSVLFAIEDSVNIVRAARGENIGTIIENG